jgi:tRNA (Thr-GGU) A37 N-methylase
VNDWTPHLIPFLADTPHGLFSTRAPKRPNPLGLSIVKLNHIQAGILFIENVDILDGTPLLDIKPYVPVFDHFEVDRIGWLEGLDSGVTTQRSDQRFKE